MKSDNDVKIESIETLFEYLKEDNIHNLSVIDISFHKYIFFIFHVITWTVSNLLQVRFREWIDPHDTVIQINIGYSEDKINLFRMKLFVWNVKIYVFVNLCQIIVDLCNDCSNSFDWENSFRSSGKDVAW